MRTSIPAGRKNAPLGYGKRLAFTGFFLVLFLLLLEFCARLACLVPGVAPPPKVCRFGSHSESMEYQYVERKRGEREPEHSYDLYSPTLGWKVRPGFDAEVTKPGMSAYHVRTNSRGVRSDREIPYQRTPGLYRILVLGASHTFGEGVSNGECFEDLLQTRLQGTEWINLAVHGYGNDQMLLYLEEEGRKYHPDLILIGFHPSVIYRNTVSFRDFAKPMFVLEDGKLKLTHVPVPTPEEVMERNRLHPIVPDCSGPLNLSYLYRFLHNAAAQAYLGRTKYLESGCFPRSLYPVAKRVVKAFMTDSPTWKKFPLDGEEWRITRAIFERIRSVAEEDHAALLLVLYSGSTKTFEQEVERFAEERGIPLCNMGPVFRDVLQKRGALYFSFDDGHLNATGHAIAADTIEKCLREEGLASQGSASNPPSMEKTG